MIRLELTGGGWAYVWPRAIESVFSGFDSGKPCTWIVLHNISLPVKATVDEVMEYRMDLGVVEACEGELR
jgi:hypothetical protein